MRKQSGWTEKMKENIDKIHHSVSDDKDTFSNQEKTVWNFFLQLVPLSILVTIFLLLLIIILGVLIVFLLQYLTEKIDERAFYISVFSAVGTLTTGVAFAGAIYAIYLQQQAIALQSKDLELTREELKHSVKAQTEQAKMLQVTSELTALNSLTESYKTQITILENQKRNTDKEKEKLEIIMKKLETITLSLQHNSLSNS